MHSFKTILTEKVLSIGINPKHEPFREKHRDQIHDIIRKAYAPIGGYSGIPSGTSIESDAIHHDITHHDMKVVHRAGKVTAVCLYKKSHGRKLIGGATDGTPEGKKDLYKIMGEDNKDKRAWAEVSGALEHIHTKMRTPTIPFDQAKKLVDKDDMMPHTDGVHYSRKIGKDRHTKLVVGFPKK